MQLNVLYHNFLLGGMKLDVALADLLFLYIGCMEAVSVSEISLEAVSVSKISLEAVSVVRFQYGITLSSCYISIYVQYIVIGQDAVARPSCAGPIVESRCISIC